MIGKYFHNTNAFVTIVSKVLILVFLFYTVAWTQQVGDVFSTLRSWIMYHFDRLYMYSVAFFLLFIIGIAISPYGKIRLCKEKAKPEFAYWSWISMLFSAGLAIGLVFWSVAEPMLHYEGNPFLAPDKENTLNAVRVAMGVVFFHWGLHPWAIYGLVGLCLSYFAYCKGLPLTIRSTLYPLLGDKIHSIWGYLADILAIFTAVFGVATSLGYGVRQIAKGLYVLTGAEFFTLPQTLYGLIVVILFISIVSAVSGVNRGVRILSEWNMWLSVIIIAIVLSVGPSLFLLREFFVNVSTYALRVIPMSFQINDRQWQSSWTIFYWAWWISWSPFVGMFIARISRGRTVREFIFGVLFVSSMLCFIWMTVFGDTALFLEQREGGILEAVKADLASAVYVMFGKLNLGLLLTKILSILITALIITYFITSADSGILVLSTLSCDGKTDSPRSQRLIWGILQGFVAIVLLYVGGVQALQTATMVATIPFLAIVWLMLWGFVKAVRKTCRKQWL